MFNYILYVYMYIYIYIIYMHICIHIIYMQPHAQNAEAHCSNSIHAAAKRSNQTVPGLVGHCSSCIPPIVRYI